MAQVPLTTGWRATTYFRAFVLNAIATAAIAALAIEMRMQLDQSKEPIYGYFAWALGAKTLSEMQKVWIVFATAFLGAILVFHLLYGLLAFGGAMIVTGPFRSGKYY
jgi:hypothetical protein